MTAAKKKAAPMTFTRADLPAHCNLVVIEVVIDDYDMVNFDEHLEEAMDRLTNYASAEVTERTMIAHGFQDAVDILRRRAVD